MALPKYIDITNTEDIPETILETKKSLFFLKMKRRTNDSFKPHEIKHTKRKLSHLITLYQQNN
uniref:Ribosomal protein L29 n=1 Tax=Olisthodiscus luteus TaxID=83000 RepID=A0A7U0QGN7_OLILU|nr:ribosomal protein L29 [Olisthodiscus luteus]QQW50588.1 ribosomal protein L29 [Olisthodiscus luteus]